MATIIAVAIDFGNGPCGVHGV
jgi:hypothetical protein